MTPPTPQDPIEPPAGDNQNPGDSSAGGPPKPPAAGDSLEQKLATLQKEAERWQKGYAGLQSALSKKDTELNALQALVQEKSGLLQTLQTTHTDVEKQLETLKTSLEENELNLTATKSQLQRAKIIMKKFPQLAEWEADGQLPESSADATDTDVETLFQSFSEKLASFNKNISQGAGGGPIPPAGGNNQSITSADAELKLANKAQMDGKHAEYDEHFNKYLELKNRKT